MSLTVALYDLFDVGAGGYILDPIPDATDIRWLDEFNGPGSGSFRVPLGSASAAAIQKHMIVECYYDGTCVFSFSVENVQASPVAEAGQAWLTVSGRGVLAWLGDGVLVPKSGDSDSAGSTKPFNFCDPIGYGKTLGVTWGACTSVSTTEPDGWPDPAALWISTSTGSGTVGAYFRKSFSAGTAKRVRVSVGSTAPFTVLMDGWTIMALGARTGYGEFRTVDLEVTSGTHYLGIVSPSAGCQVIVSVKEIDETTGQLTSVLLRSSTAWSGTTDGPAWTAGEILRQAMYECYWERDITRIAGIGIGFADATDSDSEAWNARPWREWPAGTDLLSLVTDIVEFGVDVWMDPFYYELKAWNQRGTDLSATVALTPGVNIESYDVTDSFVEISNVWVVRDGGQTWETWGITDSIKREGVVTAGDTLRNSDVAAFASQAIYATRPGPIVSNASCIPVAGAEPWLDFNPGDTITAPGIDGTPVDARVMGIAVWQDDNVVRFTPDLELGAAMTRRYALEADGKYAQTLARQTWDGSFGGQVQNATPLDDLGNGLGNPFGVDNLVGDLGIDPDGVIVSDTEPSYPSDGTVWADPSTGEISVWDPNGGGLGVPDWTIVGGGGGTGTDEVWIGPTAPGTGYKLWVDTST